MPEALPVYQREINNRMYGPSAYFWASVLSSVCSNLVYPVLLSSLTFYFLDFDNSSIWAFLSWFGILFYAAFAGICFGQAIGCVVPDLVSGVTQLVNCLNVFFLGGGVLISVNTTNPFARFAQYISPLRPSLELAL